MIATTFKLLKNFGLGFLGQWKLYTIIIITIGAYIATIKIELWNETRLKNNAIEQIKEIGQKLSNCETLNLLNKSAIDNLADINKELVDKFIDAEQDNKKVINELNTFEKEQNDKIKKLQSQIKQDDCSNTMLDDSNIELLKQAVNQN